MYSETVYSVSWRSGILCHRARESQDNPETASVTPAYQDTLSQGCWGVRESQDYPGIEGVTRRTGILCHTGAGGEGSPRIILGLPV